MESVKGLFENPFLFLFSVTKCFHYSSCKMKKLHFGSSTTLWWLFRWWCWIRFESPPLHSVQFLIHEGLWLNFHMINNSAKISSSKLKHWLKNRRRPNFCHNFLSLCLKSCGVNEGGVVEKSESTIVLDATNVTVSQQFCENHWSWPNIHEEPLFPLEILPFYSTTVEENRISW